jgi:Raf kinase inhibitor-like YbhB/YbcL family protein
MSINISGKVLTFAAIVVVFSLAGCTPSVTTGNLLLSSPAFADNSTIPVVYSCDGQNTSPALSWSGAPVGTQSFALIMHDPDAPRAGGFTHWVMFNIPPSSTGLSADVPKQAALSDGTVQGNNGAGNPGYAGPCPPAGPAHHYEFTLYALDQMLTLSAGATKDQLENAISGHILAQNQLTGLFQRS